jgi:hypothetical protein
MEIPQAAERAAQDGSDNGAGGAAATALQPPLS